MTIGKAHSINGSEVKCGWSYAYFAQPWMDSSDPSGAYDWAILVLEENLGEKMNYISVKNVSASSLVNKTMHLIGYPNINGNSNNLYRSTGTVTSASSILIQYNATAMDGYSGAAIFNSEGYVVGVHSGIIRETGVPAGAKITQNMKDIIDSI